MSKCLTFLLRVLLLMWMGLFDMFCQFHFLKVTKEVKSLIVNSLFARVIPTSQLLGYLGGGVLQIGIRVCLRSNWVKMLGHACISVACVPLTLAFHVLVALHHVDHDFSKVIMRRLMLIFVECTIMSI